MINKSISYRISVYISVAVIAIFIFFIGITYYFNSKVAIQNIENKAIAISSEFSKVIEKQIVANEEISMNIARQIVFYGQHRHPNVLVTELMKTYPFINSIRINLDTDIPELEYHNFYSFRENGTVEFQQENRQVFRCPEEERAMENIERGAEPAWSQEFICPRNNHIVIAYYHPVMIQLPNGEQHVAGEVISQLSLAGLNASINDLFLNSGDSIPLVKKGMAFIVSKKTGLFLTHPNEELIFSANMFSLPDHVYNKKKVDISQILSSNVPGSVTAYPEYYNNEKSWMYYSPIEEVGWTLIYGIPYATLFAELHLLTLRLLFFTALGILVIYLIVTYIANWLVQPLSTVTSQLKEFSSVTGNYELNTHNEVELVSKSLDYLEDWYEKYKLDRSAEEEKDLRRRQDLQEASQIQQSLINTNFSAYKKRNDLDVFAVYKPARIISGDLFDHFFLDDENLIFTIGDVSGKGVPAAFFMSVAQTIIKANSQYKRANNIVFKANNELCKNNRHLFFLTLFLGVLNVRTGVLNLCNAAHSVALILRNNGEIKELEQSHGMPLGLYPNKKYKDSRVTLKQGDLIVLYTDGVTDILDQQNKLFGYKRLLKSVGEFQGKGPQELTKHLLDATKQHMGETPQADDITIMVVEYKKSPQ